MRQETLFDLGAVAAAEASVRMVVMTSKFNGKCKRCGKPISAGTPVDWEKGKGATHVTEADCAAAPAERAPLRGPQPEDPEERMMVVDLLLAQTWKAASSKRYEKLPHEYSVKKNWASEADFYWCVEYIRRVGYEVDFIGRRWVYYDIGEKCYWAMGGDGSLEQAWIINRAMIRK